MHIGVNITLNAQEHNSKTIKNAIFFHIFCIIFSLATPIIINPNNYNSVKFQKLDRFNRWCPHFLDSYTKKISKIEVNKICN